jgi:hypothetical protein
MCAEDCDQSGTRHPPTICAAYHRASTTASIGISNSASKSSKQGVIDRGGQGAALIGNGHVGVNGEVELRKRRQMIACDAVEIERG